MSEMVELPDLFIDGYFTRRLKNGETPNYGCPKLAASKTTDEPMKVETGFMISRAAISGD